MEDGSPFASNTLSIFAPMPGSGADDLRVVQNALSGIRQTLCLTRALISQGRAVDLAELGLLAGVACAKILDLPLADGQSLKPTLAMLLIECDALQAALNGHSSSQLRQKATLCSLQRQRL